MANPWRNGTPAVELSSKPHWPGFFDVVHTLAAPWRTEHVYHAAFGYSEKSTQAQLVLQTAPIPLPGVNVLPLW